MKKDILEPQHDVKQPSPCESDYREHVFCNTQAVQECGRQIDSANASVPSTPIRRK